MSADTLGQGRCTPLKVWLSCSFFPVAPGECIVHLRRLMVLHEACDQIWITPFSTSKRSCLPYLVCTIATAIGINAVVDCSVIARCCGWDAHDCSAILCRFCYFSGNFHFPFTSSASALFSLTAKAVLIFVRLNGCHTDRLALDSDDLTRLINEAAGLK